MLIPIMSPADKQNEAKDIVLKFISALNNEDFDTPHSSAFATSRQHKLYLTLIHCS